MSDDDSSDSDNFANVEESEPSAVPQPEPEPELTGTNWFDILSEEGLIHIFNECSAQSVGRLSVCCQDFNTLLKDRV
eukprot:SAG11_NODE_3789_length_2224_cov_2.889412_1_plen_76_part_10